MDSLMKFEKLMNGMAETESDICSDGQNRLRRLSSRVFQVLETQAGIISDPENDFFNSLASSVLREIEHYESLVARAAEQMNSDLADSVRSISAPILEKVMTGYQCYLSAYQHLYECLYYGDMQNSEAICELGNEAERHIVGALRNIGDVRDEYPMVA
jgi:hypothetical protein